MRFDGIWRREPSTMRVGSGLSCSLRDVGGAIADKGKVSKHCFVICLLDDHRVQRPYLPPFSQSVYLITATVVRNGAAIAQRSLTQYQYTDLSKVFFVHLFVFMQANYSQVSPAGVLSVVDDDVDAARQTPR